MKPLFATSFLFLLLSCKAIHPALQLDGFAEMRNDYTVLVKFVDEGNNYNKLMNTVYKQVTEPLYVILSPNEQLMNHPVGYTPKEDNYREWLECGLKAYKTEKQVAKK